MIQYRYLCRIFERKCSFDDVFSLFEVDQVNVKYVSRATQSRFVVNYVTNTYKIDKNRMQYQGPDNDRAKHVSNLVLCENKSNLHQQILQWWCFLCPLPPFCFAQKIHCIRSGSYSVIQLLSNRHHAYQSFLVTSWIYTGCNIVTRLVNFREKTFASHELQLSDYNILKYFRRNVQISDRKYIFYNFCL